MTDTSDNTVVVETMREIRACIRRHTNRHVEAHKAAGKPVVGYFCHYTPPELILAAGALPLRLRGAGSEDSSLGDAFMSGRICTYVRHVVSLVLDGQYDFLDGVISLNTCDHIRRATDVFVKKSDIAFHGFLSVPRSVRESLFPYYLGELRKLQEQMSLHFGVEAGAPELRDAIRVMNENRRRLSTLNQLRLAPRPKLSGADSLAVHIASQVLPPAVFADMAERLLEGLSHGPGLDAGRGRLLLIGAELDEPEFVEAIESQGALVVADRLCFGARSVLDPISEDAADPLEAIARAYFFRPSCARMIGNFPERWSAIEEQLRESEADGIVFERLMFCDPWGADLHNINIRVKAKNIPLLALTREYNIVPTGQVKTRVQAFVEKIEIGKARSRKG